MWTEAEAKQAAWVWRLWCVVYDSMELPGLWEYMVHPKTLQVLKHKAREMKIMWSSLDFQKESLWDINIYGLAQGNDFKQIPT